MAKRKRKMTLFDVINTGPAKGLQVRHRVPTYQPVPELPVQKKLAKIFGRRGGSGQADRPLTAAEELEQLRRELAPPPPPTPEPAAREAPQDEPAPERTSKSRVTTRVVEYEPSPEELYREPAPAMSVADRARMLAAEVASDEPSSGEPRAPRRPLGERMLAAWGVISPHLSGAGRSVGRATSSGFINLRTNASRLRDLQSRYGVTAITFASVMLLFIGSFYIGRFLFYRPNTAPLTASGTAIGDKRPDVLDLSTGSGRDVVGNVDNRRVEPQLVNRQPQDATANAPVSNFGNRDSSLNYVIIQSCATRLDADATVEVLAKHKVPASVETGLGFNRTLPFAVVSRQGFNRITNNPELEAFKAKLMQISEQEAGNTVRDPFDPQPYKFRGAQR